MKRHFLTVMAIFLIVPISLFAQDTFVKMYGDSVTDYGYSVQQTTDEGYVIVGETNSRSDGGRDFWLIKTDASGDTLWTRTYGGSDGDTGYSVQQTTDEGYILVGKTSSFGAGMADIWLIKTDASGDTLWTRTFGDYGYDEGKSVQQTLDGGYIIAGTLWSYQTSFDIFLIKTNASGETLWTRTYGSFWGDYGESIQQTKDKGYIIAGTTDLWGPDADIYLIKTDASGDTLWTGRYGEGRMALGSCVQQTTDGGYIVVGYNSDDIYLIKTDASGDTLWTRTYGGTEDEFGLSVQQTTDEGYIITGSTESYDADDVDIILIKTNDSGDEEWFWTYSGFGYDVGRDVQQTTDGHYIITGNISAHFDTHLGLQVFLIKADESRPLEIKEVEVTNLLPKSLDLSQNYPNPFNPSTTIQYDIPVGSGTIPVKILVYDIRGRLVRKLT